MWERRYGFSKPGWDENGERQYMPADIAKLRAIKRLMDVGMRLGKLMAHSLDELNGLPDTRAVPHREQLAPALERLRSWRSHWVPQAVGY
jgi:DNA-binding transcriptional MerR regulator